MHWLPLDNSEVSLAADTLVDFAVVDLVGFVSCVIGDNVNSLLSLYSMKTSEVRALMKPFDV